MIGFCIINQIRIIIENPYSSLHYLHNNFLKEPSYFDVDRTRRGDFFKKPTGFWFFNCSPTLGFTNQQTPKNEQKSILYAKQNHTAGLCSEERSMISPDYARNFICDQILGIEQEYSNKQLTIF